MNQKICVTVRVKPSNQWKLEKAFDIHERSDAYKAYSEFIRDLKAVSSQTGKNEIRLATYICLEERRYMAREVLEYCVI